MTAKKSSTDEQQVRDYLLNNLSFLEENPDVFEAINISHQSGKAISLVERQVSIMRDRNKNLNDRVEQMRTSAAENAQLLEKTKKLVLNLVQAQDLKSLVKMLTVSLKEDFATEFFNLTLIDSGEISSITGANVISSEEAKSKIGGIIMANHATCGVISREESSLLFGESASDIGSVVALPLKHKTPFAVIALGNSNANFYPSDIGTIFIDYIGDLLTELVPKHLKPSA